MNNLHFELSLLMFSKVLSNLFSSSVIKHHPYLKGMAPARLAIQIARDRIPNCHALEDINMLVLRLIDK